MVIRRVALPPRVPSAWVAGLEAIRQRLAVPAVFPPAVEAPAAAAAANPRRPALDRTDLPLITIDPAGSRDLDQALHIARAERGDGYIVSYAIADVAAYVAPGDPIDVEAHHRGVTRYAPDRRTPLHPEVLSEGAASLLPDQERPALLWTLGVDAEGRLLSTDVVRARVRSTEQLTYTVAQAELDAGRPRSTLALLRDVGQARERQEQLRGGVSLEIPEQEIVPGPDRDDGPPWQLRFRTPQPVEGWNAQISLLTGMAAAQLMIDGRVGLLRTMPPADPGSVRRLRHTARALHIAWPDGRSYPDFVRTLDPARPDHAAMINACTTLFRGAGYRAFNGTVPEEHEHSALAAAYAHVTAPLRRLGDRYAGEICLALSAGEPVPDWVLTALDALPDELSGADQRAKKYERAIVDLMEAVLLADRVGEVFPATVIEVERDGRSGTVMIQQPAVEAKVKGADLPLGGEISVRLESADEMAGIVRFVAV